MALACGLEASTRATDHRQGTHQGPRAARFGRRQRALRHARQGVSKSIGNFDRVVALGWQIGDAVGVPLLYRVHRPQERHVAGSRETRFNYLINFHTGFSLERKPQDVCFSPQDVCCRASLSLSLTLRRREIESVIRVPVARVQLQLCLLDPPR